MKKFTISRDDRIYEAWPDIAMLDNGRLVCIFSECTHHVDRNLARLVIKTSDDRGRSWSEKIHLTEQASAQGFFSESGYFNCARIVKLSDGKLLILCDFIIESEAVAEKARNFFWFSADGEHWSKPVEIPLRGIVPDFCELSSGRWLAAAHYKSPETGKLTQFIIHSDDKGASWSEQRTVASDARFDLCEASLLEVGPDAVVAYMRENSLQGWDCKKAISHDGGESWEGVYDVPLSGCHRPKAGLLADGRILITYRYAQGGLPGFGRCTQNAFGAILPRDSALATERGDQTARIFPIDYDRSPVSDIGYTGWVQFPDGEIYVVDYLVDDAPNAKICASAFTLDEILLDTDAK